MGKGATKNKSSCGGFSISDRKTSNSEVSLTKLQRVWTEDNLGRPFDGGGGSAAGGVGPTGSYSGGANEALVGHHTIHRDEYVSSSSPCLNAQNSSVGANNSHPFHFFSPYSANPYRVPGEKMVPLFTNAQWAELERQAMIYKHMVSSVPVPPHLLHPTYGYSKNGAGGLMEPGRCKRTDGKKWRCSRDVAPHQKYCERHLHRGRPRSRKPVEINNNNNGDENHKKPRIQQKPRQQKLTPVANDDEQPLLLFNAKTNLSTGSDHIPSYKGSNRDFGVVMESEMVGMNGAMLELSNMGFSNDEGSSAIFDQDYMDQHGLSYSNYPEAPIGLIDAWSVDNNNNNNLGCIATQNVSIESADHENFNPWLNLSIAMTGGGNVVDDEMGSVRAGEGANFYDEGGRWLGPVCWGQFGPGGPLAEALLRNPASPHNSVSGPTVTAVSSPSGVTQRMLFSNSDSSVCNSPSEIAKGSSRLMRS